MHQQRCVRLGQSFERTTHSPSELTARPLCIMSPVMNTASGLKRFATIHPLRRNVSRMNWVILDLTGRRRNDGEEKLTTCGSERTSTRVDREGRLVLEDWQGRGKGRGGR